MWKITILRVLCIYEKNIHALILLIVLKCLTVINFRHFALFLLLLPLFCCNFMSI